MILIWNVGTQEIITQIDAPDQILSATWNFDGSKFCASFKDKMLRIYDPRKAELIAVSMN